MKGAFSRTTAEALPERRFKTVAPAPQRNEETNTRNTIAANSTQQHKFKPQVRPHSSSTTLGLRA
jgi:hypothetical protein